MDQTTLLPDPERDRAIQGVDGMGNAADLPIPDTESLEIAENPDGSATVDLEAPEAPREYDHYENLAEVLDESELSRLAMDLVRKIDIDKKARELRDKQYEEGIRRSGLGNDAPGGAAFEGASRVVHPMIAEACVDFAAAAMKEIYPPSGPVRTDVEGVQTAQKLEVANRQQEGLNWQLTEDMPEYSEELEQLMTQLPLGGSQYMKFFWDPKQGRVSCEFIPIDDYYVPYAATSFYTAERRTHVMRLTDLEFQERVDGGFYRDLDLSPPGITPRETAAGAAAAKVEGKRPDAMNEDGVRIAYECDCFAVVSADQQEGEDAVDKALPYLVTVDEQSGRILSLYRNWQPQDRRQRRLDWVTEYGFIYWRGAYKIGLPHLIGGLSAAATGALRALLDSAHVNNSPSALTLKGTRLTGQSKRIGITELTEVDAGVGVDDIRKAAMPLPFNQPSAVLYELLGWLSNAAKGVVTTAEEKISEASNQMPVGTSLALIEQGAKVFSSIHARLHRSQKRALRIISRLNAEHGQEFEQRQQEELGEVLAYGKDFAHPLSVIPVSDPNIFSETQRLAMNQMLLQLGMMGMQQGVQYNFYKIHRRILQQSKVPNIDEVLPEPRGPQELNAAAENMQSLTGSPLMAFPDQDHLAHLETHLRFVTDPLLGGSPAAAPAVIPTMVEHLKQHMGLLYAKTMFELASDAQGESVGETLKDKQQAKRVDQLLAAASRLCHGQLAEQLGPIQQIYTQMVQQAEQYKPKPPMDPSQVAMAETQRRSQRDAADIQIKTSEAQARAAKEAQEAARKAQESAAKVEKDRAELMVKAQAEQRRAALEAAGLQLDAQGQLEDVRLREIELRLKEKDIDLDAQVQILHMAAALKEDQQPGNQIAGV